MVYTAIAWNVEMSDFDNCKADKWFDKLNTRVSCSLIAKQLLRSYRAAASFWRDTRYQKKESFRHEDEEGRIKKGSCFLQNI